MNFHWEYKHIIFDQLSIIIKSVCNRDAQISFFFANSDCQQCSWHIFLTPSQNRPYNTINHPKVNVNHIAYKDIIQKIKKEMMVFVLKHLLW